MKKYFVFTLLLAAAALAENAVSSSSSAQRWPWNGKVDIDYTLIANTDKTTPVFSLRFFYQDPEGNQTEITKLDGDGATGIVLGEGRKRATWDAEAELGAGIDSADYLIGVYAEDVTEEATFLKLNLSTYKMTTSATGPSVAVGAGSKHSELWLRRVENGTFVMGSASSETGRTAAREGQHTVTISKAYYIGVFELTGGQYDKIYSNSSSTTVTPKTGISYNDLRGESYGATWPSKDDHRVDSGSFFGKLRAKTGHGLVFDLPTEAQWEMACRDKGTSNRGTGGFYGSSYWNNGTTFDSSYSGLGNVAWYNGNAGGNVTHEVGRKAASSIGTYDMHGNVNELCLDWFVENITSYTSDPKGPASGSGRVFKGGSYSKPEFCRMAYRSYYSASYVYANLGCRVALLAQ